MRYLTYLHAAGYKQWPKVEILETLDAPNRYQEDPVRLFL